MTRLTDLIISARSYLMMVLLTLATYSSLYVEAAFRQNNGGCVQEVNCRRPNCVCPSTKPPPGMLPKDTPQLVYFTFDDAVTDFTSRAFNTLFPPERKNPNGCPIPMTLFISHVSTNYNLVRSFYERGMELAVHSVNHLHIRSEEDMLYEAVQQRKNIATKARVPIENIKGWRSPFLLPYGNKHFEILKDNGFLYDSTLTIERGGIEGYTYWPMTMDYGWPYPCMVVPCPKANFTGFWEIPIVSVMDYQKNFPCQYIDGCVQPPPDEEAAFQYLWQNFESYYRNSRAPFGINMHAAWFAWPERLAGMNRFIQELVKMDDVYIVTVQQLIDYVKNPVKLNQARLFEPFQCNLARPASSKSQPRPQSQNSPSPSRTGRYTTRATPKAIRRTTVRRTTKPPTTRRPITRHIARATTTGRPTTRTPTARRSTTRAPTARGSTTRQPTTRRVTWRPTTKRATWRPTTRRTTTWRPTTRRPKTTRRTTLRRVTWGTAAPITRRTYTSMPRTTTKRTTPSTTTKRTTKYTTPKRTTRATTWKRTTSPTTTRRVTVRTTTEVPTPATAADDWRYKIATPWWEIVNGPVTTKPWWHETLAPPRITAHPWWKSNKRTRYYPAAPSPAGPTEPSWQGSARVRTTRHPTTTRQFRLRLTEILPHPSEASWSYWTRRTNIWSTREVTPRYRVITTKSPPTSNQISNAGAYDPPRQSPGNKNESEKCRQGGNCFLPHCFCDGNKVPRTVPRQQIPQIVYVTFEGPVTPHIYVEFVRVFSSRKRNPNGCPIKATFFIPSSTTDPGYTKTLHERGNEISLLAHRGDPIRQRDLLAVRTEIPKLDIKGWRSENLTPLSKGYYKALPKYGFQYDSTMISTRARSGEQLWPMTLDFGWTRSCNIKPCPRDSYPGLWEVPLMAGYDNLDLYPCTYMDGCHMQPQTTNDTFDMLWDNFQKFYTTNRAPFAVNLRHIWFHYFYMYKLDALNQFIDKLVSMEDVYIVTINEMLEWIKDPVPLNELTNYQSWQCF